MKKKIWIKHMTCVLLAALAAVRLTAVPAASAAPSSQTFTIPVRLEKAAEPGTLSMGNQAMGQTATVVETRTGASIYLSFSAMTFSGLHGHLTKMYSYENGGLHEAAVTDTVTDTGVDGQQGVFPSGVVIQRGGLRESAFTVRVRVDAMDAIIGSEGGGEQDATLVLDYSAAPKSLADQDAEEAAKAEAVKAEAAKAEAAKAEAAKAEAAKAEAAKAEAAKAEAAKAEAAKAEESKSADKAEDNTEKKRTDEPEKPAQPRAKVEDYFKAKKDDFSKGAYLIEVSGLYLNPLDGLTADGGTKNAGIGEGMVDGVVTPSGQGFSRGAMPPAAETGSGEKYAKALLQKTGGGQYYATLRLHLMNFITRDQKNGPFIRLLQRDGSFKEVKAELSAEHIETYGDSYADYRFPVEDPHFLAQIEMFVEPMARAVTFFVESHPERFEEGYGDFTLPKEKAVVPVPVVIGIGVGVVVVLAGLALVLIKRKGGRSHE